MVEQAPPDANALPLACAVLDRFDPVALGAVTGFSSDAAQALCAGPLCESIAGSAERYRFRPDVQALLLARLRRDSPYDEQLLHRRAFDHFLQRLEAQPDEQHRLDDQLDCFHHLHGLFYLNRNYQRWDEMSALIEALRRHGPLQPDIDAELMIYSAFNDLHLQRYERAEALLQRVLDRADLPPNLRAAALNTQGLIFWRQARFAPALALGQAVLDLGGVRPKRRGVALLTMSWIYHQLNQKSAALDLARQSLECFRADEDLYGATFARYTIGNNALHLGLWPLAQEHLDQAAATYTAARMPARLAMVDWARGLLYQILGDEAGSERAYLSALAAAEAPHNRNLVTLRDTLTWLGLLYHTQGRLNEATSAYTRAIEIAQDLRDDHWLVTLLHRRGAVQLDQGRSDEAFETLRLAIRRVEALRSATQGEAIALALLGTAQQTYEAIVLLCLRRGDPVSAFGYVERARARAFLDLLARRDAALAARLAQRPVALADVQSRLAPDTLLLEYFTIGDVSSGERFLTKIPPENTRLRDHLVAPPEILLFAVTHDRLEVHRIAFDPNRLQPLPNDPMPGRHLLTERKLSWLHKLLIAPVQHLVAGRRLLYIVPHGPLHYLAFAALRAPNGTTLLSLNGPALAYAPSATVLHACLDRPTSRGDRALALGYNATGAQALRFAEGEARHIAEITRGQALAGPEPKSSALTELAPQLRQLHIAGHAVFLPDDPLGSYLRLGADDRLDARTLMQQIKLSADLVTLNACTSGLSHVVPGDELLGLPRALLYAGAATVVCTLAEVDDLAAYLIMEAFYRNLTVGYTPAGALHAAQTMAQMLSRAEAAAIIRSRQASDPSIAPPAIDQYDDPPFAHPRYWAPFIVIGRP